MGIGGHNTAFRDTHHTEPVPLTIAATSVYRSAHRAAAPRRTGRRLSTLPTPAAFGNPSTLEPSQHGSSWKRLPRAGLGSPSLREPRCPVRSQHLISFDSGKTGDCPSA